MNPIQTPVQQLLGAINELLTGQFLPLRQCVSIEWIISDVSMKFFEIPRIMLTADITIGYKPPERQFPITVPDPYIELLGWQEETRKSPMFKAFKALVYEQSRSGSQVLTSGIWQDASAIYTAETYWSAFRQGDATRHISPELVAVRNELIGRFNAADKARESVSKFVNRVAKHKKDARTRKKPDGEIVFDIGTEATVLAKQFRALRKLIKESRHESFTADVQRYLDLLKTELLGETPGECKTSLSW